MERVVLALTCLTISSCVIAQAPPHAVSTNRPGWIEKGSGFFKGEAGKAFYGVGVSSGVSDVSLRRDDADAAARVDLARTFRSRIKNLLKAYRAATGTGEKAASERHIENATKAFTDVELNGVPVIDRYYDTAERAQYSLVTLNAKAFKEQLAQARGLSEASRAAIRERAAEAFDALEESAAANRRGR